MFQRRFALQVNNQVNETPGFVAMPLAAAGPAADLLQWAYQQAVKDTQRKLHAQRREVRLVPSLN